MEVQMDRSNMKDKIYELPEQILAAVELTERAGIEIRGEIRNVVIAGMGGSAIAGDVMKAAVRPRGSVPIEIVRYYSLPQFVDQKLSRVSRRERRPEQDSSAYRVEGNLRRWLTRGRFHSFKFRRDSLRDRRSAI
jgi:adenine C2-methylase RlmN of 23S rRNA A2503 and tRNA A37